MSALRSWRRLAERTGVLALLALPDEDLGDGGDDLSSQSFAVVGLFAAIWKVASSKRGISALELQQALGLGSQETAWTMLHKLRIAMVRPNRDVLSRHVQVDETYVGGKEKGVRGRKIGATKAIVAIAVEVRGPVTGRVRLERIENASEATLTDFVYRNVAPDWLINEFGFVPSLEPTLVETDAWQGYSGLRRNGYAHRIVNLNASREPAHISLPHVHHVASHLKRWLLGTHQGGIKKRHLDAYLNEFEFRYNRRNSKRRGLLFQRLVEQAASHGPTEFQAIRGGKP